MMNSLFAKEGESRGEGLEGQRRCRGGVCKVGCKRIKSFRAIKLLISINGTEFKFEVCKIATGRCSN